MNFERSISERTAVSRLGLAAFGGFIATIFAANWLIEHVGIVSVGFGLLAPAGVFMVGVAFTLRDILQRTLGAGWTIAAIFIGAALSYFVSPAFAVASGVAFLLSELADLAVYTPLARRTWLGAVALSNTVGLVVDSVLFLAIAFGSQEFLAGQIVGKAWMTALAVVLLAAGRRLAPVNGMRVYLGGPINGCTDDEASGWRESVKPMLEAHGYAWLDPMDRDYRGREMEPGIAAEIVELDKADIDTCDVLLMNCPKPSVGTSMEVLYGWMNGKRIVSVIPPGSTPSPWLVYHSHDLYSCSVGGAVIGLIAKDSAG